MSGTTRTVNGAAMTIYHQDDLQREAVMMARRKAADLGAKRVTRVRWSISLSGNCVRLAVTFHATRKSDGERCAECCSEVI